MLFLFYSQHDDLMVVASWHDQDKAPGFKPVVCLVIEPAEEANSGLPGGCFATLSA